MFHVIRRDELPPSPNRTVQFEGEPYRVGISLFLVDNSPVKVRGRISTLSGDLDRSRRTSPHKRRAGGRSRPGPATLSTSSPEPRTASATSALGASRSSAYMPPAAWSPSGWPTRTCLDKAPAVVLSLARPYPRSWSLL